MANSFVTLLYETNVMKWLRKGLTVGPRQGFHIVSDTFLQTVRDLQIMCSKAKVNIVHYCNIPSTCSNETANM